jgi:hypothetical protein
MREVCAQEARQLRQLDAELHALLSGDLARLNEMAKHLAVPNIIVPAATQTSRTSK